MREVVNEVCNTVSRVERDLVVLGRFQIIAGCRRQTVELPKSSMGPHRGDVQHGSSSVFRRRRRRIAHAKIVRNKGADWFLQREVVCWRGGVRLCPCVAQSLHLSDRAGRRLLLCASPKRKLAWLNSGGSILRVALGGMASHLLTI
jgi:hypothetical protein